MTNTLWDHFGPVKNLNSNFFVTSFQIKLILRSKGYF